MSCAPWRRQRQRLECLALAVRSHPASLLVTARNKMGSGKKVTTLVGLSNKFVETSKVSIKPSDLSANLGDRQVACF